MKALEYDHWTIRDRNTREVIAEEYIPRIPGAGASKPSTIFDSKFILGQHDYCWNIVTAPPKQKTKEQLASMRQKRLDSRMKKYELLGDILKEDELAMKKNYYSGETEPELERAHKEIIEKIEREYNRAKTFCEEQ